MPQPIPLMMLGQYNESTLGLRAAPQFAMMIGMVASEWARMEQALGEMFSLVTGEAVHYIGSTSPFPCIHKNQVALATMRALESLSARLGVLRESIEDRFDQDIRDQYDVVASKIRKVAKGRNILVHGLWGFSPNYPDCVILNEDDKAYKKYTVKDAEEILDRVVGLVKVVCDFRDVCMKVVESRAVSRPPQKTQ